MDSALGAQRHGGGVVGRVQTLAGGLNADQLHAGIGQEFGKHANRVGAAADAGGHHIRQLVVLRQKLRPRFAPDDALKVAHHFGKRVRPDHRADGVDEVDRVFQVLLKRAIDRVLERARAARDGHQFAAQNFHLDDVGVLFGDVDFAHVNFAVDAHQRTSRGQRHAVLASAGLGNHFGLAHVLGQQRLAQAVVNFVRAGVVEVFAFQINLRPALARRQALGMKNRAGPANIVRVQIGQLLLKPRRLAHGFIGVVDVVHHRLELRRNDLPAVFAKVALCVGHF